MYLKEKTDYKKRSWNIIKYYRNINNVTHIGATDMYNLYAESIGNKEPIPKYIATGLFLEFMRKTIDNIIFNGLEFHFPMGLGTLGILKKERPKMVIDKDGIVRNKRFNYIVDWIATKKDWETNPNTKRKYIYKELTSDYLYYFKYNKDKNHFAMTKDYEFKLSRKVRRKFSEIINNNMIDKTKIYIK